MENHNILIITHKKLIIVSINEICDVIKKHIFNANTSTFESQMKLNDSKDILGFVILLLPYFDFFATNCNVLPDVRSNVLTHPPSNSSISADAVPFNLSLPNVPLVYSIVMALLPIEYKFIALGNNGLVTTLSVRKRTSTLFSDCE